MVFLDDNDILSDASAIWWSCINGQTSITLDLAKMQIVSVKTRLNKGDDKMSSIQIILIGEYNSCDYVRKRNKAQYLFNQTIRSIVKAYSCTERHTSVAFDYDNAKAICSPTINVNIEEINEAV